MEKDSRRPNTSAIFPIGGLMTAIYSISLVVINCRSLDDLQLTMPCTTAMVDTSEWAPYALVA
jgi:hypothetical protein